MAFFLHLYSTPEGRAPIVMSDARIHRSNPAIILQGKSEKQAMNLKAPTTDQPAVQIGEGQADRVSRQPGLGNGHHRRQLMWCSRWHVNLARSTPTTTTTGSQGDGAHPFRRHQYLPAKLDIIVLLVYYCDGAMEASKQSKASNTTLHYTSQK